MSDEELWKLSYATLRGLVGRLRRVAPREAQAAQAGMRLAKLLFPWLVKSVGINKASGMVSALIATQPIKRIEAVLRNGLELNPVTLLMEYGMLVDNMPSRRNLPARQSWLRQQKASARLTRDSAPQSDGDLAELILAERHTTNQGKIHKLLAKASRLLKPELVTKTSSE